MLQKKLRKMGAWVLAFALAVAAIVVAFAHSPHSCSRSVGGFPRNGLVRPKPLPSPAQGAAAFRSFVLPKGGIGHTCRRFWSNFLVISQYNTNRCQNAIAYYRFSAFSVIL